MKMARIGVLLDRRAAERRQRYGINVFEGFVGELLAHMGIEFEWIGKTEELRSLAPDVTIIASAGQDEAAADTIWQYMAEGGTVISYAGQRELAAKLGCFEQPEIAAGYADANIVSGKSSRVLRFLSATPWEQADPGTYPAATAGSVRKDTPAGTEAGYALQRFAIGKGKLERWSVNIPKSIVLFQQGTGPVLSDGIPAKDGTGSVDEWILKADDRCGMDWELDRLRTGTGAPYFAYPYADYWKEELIGHLLLCVTSKGLTTPFLGYWPDGIPAVATISHDSDSNIDETAETTLDVLQECGIHTTWCMIEPGYSPFIYDRVKRDGHELAFHYNSLEAQKGKWGEEEFSRQYEWLKHAAGLERAVSNKNHYTRFEGWGELFAWCEKNGIQADQTRGPSKKGNIGFLFGTCHPYFPISWFDEGNRMYDVLEISFLTQDLDHAQLADSSVIEPFLDRVAGVEGVAHFLFHQVHIHQQPAVRQALRSVVAEARKRGFALWTSEQINDWERKRRGVRIAAIEASGDIVLKAGSDAEHAVVYIPVPGRPTGGTDYEIRFGVPCRRVVLNSSAGKALI